MMPSFRFVLSAVVVVLLTTCFSIVAKAQYHVDLKKALKDEALYGHAYRNLTVKIILDCFHECIKDCVCMAFHMLGSTECQLLSSNRFQAPFALHRFPGCSYYDILAERLQQSHGTKRSYCNAGWNCCRDSRPCINDGKCEPVFGTDVTARYRCLCPDGYTGNHCQHPIKSCRGYINGSRVAGKYKVFDDNMRPFEVFCDFDSTVNIAWSLIASYQLQKIGQFNTPYYWDNPVNEETPAWDSYRLSRSRMKSIERDSRKWRITCQYDTGGMNQTDYLQAAINEADILNLNGNKLCVKMEYISIRGGMLEQCTVGVYQNDYYVFHVDSYRSNTCQFKPTGSFSCGGAGEDNFGFYECINPAHRCSATPTSTTQTWFGGQ